MVLDNPELYVLVGAEQAGVCSGRVGLHHAKPNSVRLRWGWAGSYDAKQTLEMVLLNSVATRSRWKKSRDLGREHVAAMDRN